MSDDLFNVMTYDEALIRDQLDLTYGTRSYTSNRSMEQSIEQRIKARLNEDSIDRQVQDEIKSLHAKPRVVEHFTSGGCACGGDGFSVRAAKAKYQQHNPNTQYNRHSPEHQHNHEGYCGGSNRDDRDDSSSGSGSLHDLSNFLSDKFLIIMVFLLAVICVIQYVNQQQMTHDMKAILLAVYQSMNGNGASGNGANGSTGNGVNISNSGLPPQAQPVQAVQAVA